MNPTTTTKKHVRNKNWTVAEDEQLCRSYLAVSNDLVAGADQGLVTFWDQVKTHYFTANGGKDPNNRRRQSRSFDSRWANISLPINKYVGFLAQVQRRNQSGSSAEIEREALNLFAEVMKKPFRLMHCYRILAHCPNWKTTVDVKLNAKSTRKRMVPPGANVAAHATQGDAPAADLSHGSRALVVVEPEQHLDGTPEPSICPPGEKQENERAWSGKRKNLEDIMAAMAQTWQEVDRLAEKQTKLMEYLVLDSKKRTRIEEANHLTSVMMADTSSITDPACRAWMAAYQAQIMEKGHFPFSEEGTDDSNGGGGGD